LPGKYWDSFCFPYPHPTEVWNRIGYNSLSLLTFASGFLEELSAVEAVNVFFVFHSYQEPHSHQDAWRGNYSVMEDCSFMKYR